MGLSVSLMDERGKKLEAVHDPKNYLHDLLSDVRDDSPTLRYIDWYGLTLFNRPQMEVFIPEWRQLATHATTADARRLVEAIGGMARRVEKEVHLYLRFDGD